MIGRIPIPYSTAAADADMLRDDILTRDKAVAS
jgi:hypothetical protein